MTLPGYSGGNVNAGADIPLFDDIFTVSAFSPQRININTPPLGATIANIDTANSIWVGPSAGSAMPNIGTLLGPGGSMTWGHPSEIPYACLDPAATGPVLGTVSTAAQNVQNPQLLAEAVAIAILNAGIPNVLVQNLVMAFQPTGLLPSRTAPIKTYASIIVTLAALTGSSYLIRVVQKDINGDVVNNTVLGIDSTTDIPASWIIPVVGVTLTVSGNVGSTIAVIGTNRPTPGPLNLNDTGTLRNLTFAGALVANTPVSLVPSAADNATGQTDLNGQCSYVFFSNTAGQLLLVSQGANGGLASIVAVGISDAVVGTNVRGIVMHPLNSCRWLFLPSSANAAGSVSFTIWD